MKTSVEKAFSAVTITLETQKEVDKIYAIMNCSKIVFNLDLEVEANQFRDSVYATNYADDLTKKLVKM